MPLRLYQRPDSPHWWIRGTVSGVRVRESTGTDRQRLAEEYRAKREAEIYRARLHHEPAPVTFAAAALSYLDIAERSPATRHRLGRLLPAIGPKRTVRQIDQALLDDIAGAVLRHGAAPATKLREVVTPIRSVLDHAARRGWCSAPRFERVKLPPGRTLWLTPGEAETIIAASARHLAPLLTWLFCTGCRLGEALALEWSAFDGDFDHVTILQSKTGRDRLVEIPPRGLRAIEMATDLVPAGRLVGRVFRRDDGEPYAAKDGLGGGQIKKAWAGALRRSEVAKPATPHTCRHSWASWRYACHHDLLRLRDEGGWRSVDLVERYAHLAPDGIAEEARRFWRDL